MTVNRSITHALTACLAVFAVAATAHAQLRIGTFDTARGGSISFGAGADQSTIRSNITSSFPGATFSTTNTLTPAFLANVDVVLLASPRAGNDAITPLSAAEQAALLQFVLGGKGAVLFPDNNTFDGANSEPANESLLDPFGIDITGSLANSQAVTAPNPAGNPITNGPFGQISSMTYAFTGFFDNLGPNAQSLATLNANGESALALITKGTLGAGSGGVVAFSDASMSTNPFLTANNSIAIRNAIAYVSPSAAPEPATLALMGLPLLGFVRRRKR